MNTGQPNPGPESSAQIDQMKLQMLMQQLRDNQNLSMAVIGGLIAAAIGAAVWAALTVVTGWQIGIMAIAIGFLVGWTVRKFGQGVDVSFGVTGGFISLLGCFMGNYLAVVGFTAWEFDRDFFDVLVSLQFERAVEIMIDSFQPMDIVFYGLAVYYGYRYSIRGLTAAELNSVLRK